MSMRFLTFFGLFCLLGVHSKAQFFITDAQFRLEAGITINNKYVVIPSYTLFDKSGSNSSFNFKEQFSENSESGERSVSPGFGFSAVFNTSQIVMPYVNVSFVQLKGNYNYTSTETGPVYVHSDYDTVYLQNTSTIKKNYSCNSYYSFLNYNAGVEFKIYKGLRLGIGGGAGIKLKNIQTFSGTEVTETRHKGYAFNYVDENQIPLDYTTVDENKRVDNIKINAKEPGELAFLNLKILYQHKIDKISFGIHLMGSYCIFARAPYFSAGINFSLFTVNDEDD